MSDAADAVGGIVGGIGDAISGAVKAVSGVISGIGNAISGVVSGIGKTVNAILKNPLPTLLQVAGAYVGIPPYVTAAVITASRGGNLEDIAKTAAVSYATTSFMADTEIGADIKNYTTNAWSGDFTDSMMEKFNLPADTAVQISKVASASLNSSLVGGINAALTGRPIGQGIASGFTSGLVYASTDSYFNSINKDPNWGFSEKALNVMKGATSTALNTIISGKGDPAQALGNYIAYATINIGGTSLAQSAKDAYKLLTTDTEAAKAAQDKYTLEKANYDTKVTAGEALRNGINTDAVTYQKILDEQYDPFKKEYDKLAADNENAVKTFTEQKNIFDEYKWGYDNYDKKLKQDGWESSYDSESGSTTYFKRSGGSWQERQIYDPEDGTTSTVRTYVPDSSYSSGEDTITSVKYDYNHPSQQSFADKANAAAKLANTAAETATSTQTQAQTLHDNNKTMLDGLSDSKAAIDKKIADLSVIKKDVEDVTVEGSTAAKLKAAADAYQTKYDAWSKTKDAADRSAENYTKALAEVATRDATIDALNTGAIKVTSKDADGNWTLSNGMILTNQGKFTQDGQQVFTNAAGIPQKVMDFTATDGSKIDFNNNAGRVLSTSDVQNICKRDYGFTPTDAEAAKLTGGTYTNAVTSPITDLANQKARDTYFSAVGKEPTADQLDQFRKSGNVINSAADTAINGLDLPPGYVSPGTSVDQKVSFGQAYAAARSAYGNGATFEWNGKQYTTENKEEQTKRFDTYLNDAQNRINMMPANDVAGAGRGFLGGKPAGAENIYYGKKDNNVYVDTRTFDAMGNVTGGSLQLADDKTATNVRATNILSQMAATGAQGIGELMQNYANAVALATGSDLNNTTYKLGKAIERWGADRDGTDVAEQTKNIQAAITKAGKTGNLFDQVSIIAKAAKDNPLGFISDIGKEVVQEGPAWAVGAVAGGVMLTMGAGVGAVALTAAGVSAALDGLESFGSGGREAYDALKKAGVPEDVAREKAMINGAIHAAVTFPAEFIADKSLFKAYLSSVSGGVKEYAAKYGSTIATNSLSEFLEAVPQNLSTQQITTGKMDIKAATAGAFYEGMIGGGTVTTMAGPAAVNDAAIVAKDYAGKDVSLKELMNGTRDVNLSTINSSADIGKTTNGGTLTLGAVTAAGVENGFTTDQINTFLPSTVTDYSTVVYKGTDGTPITLGNIDSIVKKNPSLDFSKVMDTMYSTPSAEFKTVFNPSVLSGSTELKSAVDYEKTARDAGFPTYAAYKQYGGNSVAYQTVQNINLATAAGFPDYASYTKFNGDKAAYEASKAVATTTTNNVSMDAVTQAINAAIAGIKLPAGVSMDSVVTAIKNFAAQNPTLSAADVTSAVKDYMTANPSITTADVNTAVTNATKGLATKADIANAIANIKLPAGITAADVTSAIQDYMSKNAGLNSADVTSAVATYMTNHPGLAAADIKTAISDATKDFATKKDIETAIAGIKFPNGLSAADVSAQITAVLKANPGLTAADVTTAITAYMTAHPGVSAADVSTAITASTKDLVSTKTFNTAIEGLGLDVKTKFDSLTQGQKDIVKAYTQQGVDLNKAINDSAKLTADQITGVKTQLTALTGDVKTKFDALTQGQKDIVNSQVQMGVDLNAAINNAAKQTTDLTKNITDVQTQLNTRINDLVKQGMTIQEATNQAIKETQGQVTDLGTSLNTRINDLVKQGVTIQEATNQAIKETQGQIQTVKTDLTKNITDVQTQFNTRVNELMKQGQDYQTATQNALKELSGGVTDLKKQEEERVKAEKAKTEESRQQSSLSQAVSILAPTAAALVDTSSPGFKDIGYKNTGATKFESVLSPFEKMVEENSYANKPQTEQQPQPQQAAPVNENLNPQKPQQEGSDYFNYGTQNEIDQMLGSNPGTQMLYSKAGGLATPLMAGGGSTRYGRYAGGGLPVVQHSGKARVDFRHGDAVTGPGDGQSDDIPAMLADGEFVFPADVVAALGNGSTKAGSDKLYDMMHSIRAYHRSAKPKDLPPPAKKSPLDYLTKPARKARR